MGKFILSDEQLNKICESLDETGGFLITGAELKHWIEFYVNNEANIPPPGFNFYKMPAHADYTDGKCPGIFNEIKDGALVCNECGKSVKEVIDDLQDFKDNIIKMHK